MGIGPLDLESRLQVYGYKRVEMLATWDAAGSKFEEAYQTAVYGNDEPALVRMGKTWDGFIFKKWYGVKRYRRAVVIVDDRMDEQEVEFYRWDRRSYQRPILFVAAVVRIVEGM